MREEMCFDCYYFQDDRDDEGFGWCERYPPVLADTKNLFHVDGWAIPYLQGDGRCGEFKQK